MERIQLRHVLRRILMNAWDVEDIYAVMTNNTIAYLASADMQAGKRHHGSVQGVFLGSPAYMKHTRSRQVSASGRKLEQEAKKNAELQEESLGETPG